MKHLLFSLLIFVFVFSSCEEKEKNDNAKGSVQFEVTNTSNTQLKSAINSPMAKTVLVSVVDNEQNLVYSNEKIELSNFNGSYISSPLSLKTGEYNLTEFMVLDSTGNVIYASPKKGSINAYLVSQPLEIPFIVSKDVVTKLNPEVLSTKSLQPSDFGYATFSFSIIKTFDFLVSVFVYNETLANYELTNASSIIYGDDKNLYALPLEAKTNQLTVNADYSNYKLMISKSGYEISIISISSDSLKKYFNYPLVVLLHKTDLNSGLVAYYPFNGNANDASGNGNNGTVYGATLVNDRNGNSNAAYSFNGTDNYIDCGNNSSLKRFQTSFSISFWISLSDFSSSYLSAILSNRFKDQTTGYTTGSLLNIYGNYYENSGDPILYRKLGFSLFEGVNTSYIISDQQIQQNTWTHIVFTYDYKGNNNNIVTIYLNGIESSSAILSNIPDPGIVHTFIGYEPSPNLPTAYHLNGILDEMRIYNRVLNAEEIKELGN